ncbi:MAG: LptE family protein [Calditrichota bacterium]
MKYSSLLIAAVLLCGCTYSFRGQTAGNIKTISIPTFENETAEFGIAERVTDELVRGFQRDGTLRITTTDQADAVLVGRITRIEDLPYTARGGEAVTVEEYRFAISCAIDLVNSQTQEPIWSQGFSSWSIYAYDGNPENRDLAIEDAVGKLQQDLLNRIVGSW